MALNSVCCAVKNSLAHC